MDGIRTIAPSSCIAHSFVLPIGCGKISSAVCRGYAGADGTYSPKKIMVLRRSADKSAALQAEYPELVTVCDSNEEIVKIEKTMCKRVRFA